MASNEEYYSRVQRNQQQIPPTKKKKKHRILKGIFLVFLALILFISFQFYQGYKKGTSQQNATSEIFHGQQPGDGSTNILLVGSDARPNDKNPSRSDTIMILHIGKGRQGLKLLSIMRDTYVNIPGVGMNKINAAHAYGGVELLRQTLQENFGIKTQYFAEVNFQTFEEVIGALFPKGVSLNVEKDLDLDDTVLKKGEQVLDPHQLLNYARFRKDEEGDFGRVRRQQQVIHTLVDEIKSPSNLLHLPKAAGVAFSHTKTNISFPKGLYLGLSNLLKGNLEVKRLALPVKDSWSYGNYADAGSVIEINFEKNQEAIRTFFEK